MRFYQLNKSLLIKSIICLPVIILCVSTSKAELIGEYTFNDTGSGTIAQRMPVAMGATSVVAEATLSELLTNTTFQLDFAGFNNVPNTDYDGYGFGANIHASKVIFFYRAEQYYETAWFINNNMSAAVQPLNFTVTAEPGCMITVESITITPGARIYTVYACQEALTGTVLGTTYGTDTYDPLEVPLDTPVEISSTSKTFTIYMNSVAYGTPNQFDNIAVNGTVVPEPVTIGILGLATFGLIIFQRFNHKK